MKSFCILSDYFSFLLAAASSSFVLRVELARLGLEPILLIVVMSDCHYLLCCSRISHLAAFSANIGTRILNMFGGMRYTNVCIEQKMNEYCK
jgi:hypothetical protein